MTNGNYEPVWLKPEQKKYLNREKRKLEVKFDKDFTWFEFIDYIVKNQKKGRKKQ